MYINSSNITLPEDNDTIVWKYLDLSKFLDMLLSQQLFMSRSDKFEDQYEGTFSEPTFEEIKKIAANKPEFLDYYKSHREKVVISSWHINEYESFAMWQIFTKNNEGLAIQSTIGRLKEALQPENRIEQYIGNVNYIDYKKEYVNGKPSRIFILGKKLKEEMIQSRSAIGSQATTLNENKNRNEAGFSVPAQGLFLTKIEYDYL